MAADLDRFKGFCHVTHDADDVLLQSLLDAALADMLAFVGLSEVTDSAQFDVAVMMQARAYYDGQTGTDVDAWSQAARQLAWSLRTGLGV